MTVKWEQTNLDRVVITEHTVPRSRTLNVSQPHSLTASHAHSTTVPQHRSPTASLFSPSESLTTAQPHCRTASQPCTPSLMIKSQGDFSHNLLLDAISPSPPGPVHAAVAIAVDDDSQDPRDVQVNLGVGIEYICA